MTQRKDQLCGSWGSSECIIMLSCGKCKGISAAIIKAWNVTAMMTGEHKAEYCTNYKCTILITIINSRGGPWVFCPIPKSRSLTVIEHGHHSVRDRDLVPFFLFFFSVAFRPQRPFRLLEAGSPERPLPLLRSSCALGCRSTYQLFYGNNFQVVQT